MNALYVGLVGKSLFCAPATGLQEEQLRLIAVKSLKNKPESLHEPARATIVGALMQAFPCEH